MYKSPDELNKILKELIGNAENECVEFKQASNNYEIDKLGKYFSAIGNEATLRNKQYGWIVFGINDKTHTFTHTNYCKDDNFNDTKKQIADNTTDNITFIEIYPFYVNDKRVIMFQVPAATGTPINWKGFPYGRIGESLVPLEQSKIEQIKATANYDWSRQIIEDATIDNLDKAAIEMARSQYKIKHQGKSIAEEIDDMSDIDFLNKAKITINGKITYTAMLLLGKNDDDYLMGEYNAKMTWKLYDDVNVIDYEHFGIPFIINVEKLKNKIRNLRYRYIINDDSLFPNEVDQYDTFILRELINNCVVHQDYRLKGTIYVSEFKDKLLITNEGNFIPKNIETVLKAGFSSPYYRNPFLANAMVNINMIDTAGSGIKRVYSIQKEKFFPMPDYDLSEKNRVKVTLYGKILDENYSKLLFEKTNLDIEEVILLDRVQKSYSINKEQSLHLKNKKLIEGKYPKIYISANIAALTNKQVDYIDNKGLEDSFYKELILQYIKEFKFASRQQINDLIKPKLSNLLTPEQQNNKVRSLLAKLRDEKKIINIGVNKLPKWIINENKIDQTNKNQ